MQDDIAANPEIAQTEKIGLGDLVIAGLIAVVTVGVTCIWEFPGLYPGVWKDAAVAAGVRPAESVLPGYWTGIANLGYHFFGIAKGDFVLRWLGHLSLAWLAVTVYCVLREWLSFAMRMRPQFSVRRTFVMRLSSVIGAAAFIAADPIWTSGQCLTETTVLLLLTLGVLEGYFVFLRKGEIRYAYLCSLLSGLLAAETPIGIILPILLISLYLFIIKVVPNMESPLFKPAVIEVGKWHMTFLFMVGLIGGIALNSWLFVYHHGIGAIGETLSAIPLLYLQNYWALLSGAGSISSWILWLGVCLLPFVVTAIKMPGAADEDQFLPYGAGIIFLACGIVAYSQVTFLPSLWFWNYFPFDSQFVLSLGLCMCVAALACAVTILGVDSLCRNHQQLTKQFFGEEMDDNGEVVAAVNSSFKSRSTAFLRRLAMMVVPVALLGLLIPGRIKTNMRQMLAVIESGVKEIVTEAGDAEYLFTDGNLDTGIELESARRGGSLKCYTLMGGSGKFAAYLRGRNLKDAEDRFSFGYDSAMGLRSWIRDKPDRLKESAALMGFDLWKRDGKPLPPMSGLVSRLAGFESEEVRQRGIDAANVLAEQMLAVHALRGGTKDCIDEEIRRMFFALEWRMARMNIYRAEADDVNGNAELAIAESQLAKRLNDENEVYKDLVEAMDKRRSLIMQKLTPREGLQLALVRADFLLGKTYAETIIAAEPDNPDANFAMGMYYLGERQLSRAERYLTRCLIRRPNEAAIYNNLAMIEIELKKFAAAKVNIEKAFKLIPGSSAVQDTKRKLEEAMKNSQ